MMLCSQDSISDGVIEYFLKHLYFTVDSGVGFIIKNMKFHLNEFLPGKNAGYVFT